MEIITSSQSRQFKRIKSLLLRKYRDRYKEYIVEGTRGVQDILAAHQAVAIFVKDGIQVKADISALLQEASRQGCDVFVVNPTLYSELEETVHGQGILAISRQKLRSYEEFTVERGLYLLLDTIQEPGNLGTIIRTAVAGGVAAIFLTKGCVDLYNDKVVRSAISALNKIPIYTLTDEEADDLLNEKGLLTVAAALANAKDYREISYQKPLLLVLGNEGNGIRPEIIKKCQNTVKIPLYGDMESLNVAIASGILIYKAQEMTGGC